MFNAFDPPQCIFAMPGDFPFSVFAASAKHGADRIFESDMLKSQTGAFHDGDLLVINERPKDPLKSGRYVVVMIHRDRHGQCTGTKLVEVPHDPTALRALLAGMPAALRPEPTETQPKRERRMPEPARLADGPTDSLVRTAIAQERDAELKAYYGDTDSGATAASGGDGGSGSADPGGQGGNGKGNRMNLR